MYRLITIIFEKILHVKDGDGTNDISKKLKMKVEENSDVASNLSKSSQSEEHRKNHPKTGGEITDAVMDEMGSSDKTEDQK